MASKMIARVLPAVSRLAVPGRRLLVSFGGAVRQGMGMRGKWPLRIVGGVGAWACVSVLAGGSSVLAKEPVLFVPQERRPREVVLYQFESCPFCMLVKSFLENCGIPYTKVEVSPMDKSQIKQFGAKKVPVVVVDGDVLEDSQHIVSTLASKWGVEAPAGSQREEEAVWRDWAHKHFVRVAFVNINRSIPGSIETGMVLMEKSGYPLWKQLLAAPKAAFGMQMGARKMKRDISGLDNEIQAWQDSLEAWVSALQQRPMMGGARPNIADLSVFGVLRAIEGLGAFHEAMAKPSVQGWYQRVKDATISSA